MSLRLMLCLSLCALGVGCKRPPKEKAPIRVAAAADLTAAFEDLGKQFEQQTGETLAFSFGSTGLLSKQIKEGAPFDLFAAANVSYVTEVLTAGACDEETRVAYARGRVAIWAPDKKTSLADLAGPRFVKIAIANPEYAPYGVAAKEALTSAHLWETVQPRIVYGENVRQTLQLAESGNVEAAIVALSLVIQKKEGAWTLIDEGLHQPIDQALVACRLGRRSDGGRAFGAFVNSKTGRETMRRYGFVLPGETLPTY